jgi:hypothetical protein
MDLVGVINTSVAIVFQYIEDWILFSVYPDICLSCEALIFTIVKGSSELGICCTEYISHIVGPKEVARQENIIFPSIPYVQSRLGVETSRVLATKGRPV